MNIRRQGVHAQIPDRICKLPGDKRKADKNALLLS